MLKSHNRRQEFMLNVWIRTFASFDLNRVNWRYNCTTHCEILLLYLLLSKVESLALILRSRVTKLFWALDFAFKSSFFFLTTIICGKCHYWFHIHLGAVNFLKICESVGNHSIVKCIALILCFLRSPYFGIELLFISLALLFILYSWDASCLVEGLSRSFVLSHTVSGDIIQSLLLQ
jgi:hypothetical protein